MRSSPTAQPQRPTSTPGPKSSRQQEDTIIGLGALAAGLLVIAIGLAVYHRAYKNRIKKEDKKRFMKEQSGEMTTRPISAAAASSNDAVITGV